MPSGADNKTCFVCKERCDHIKREYERQMVLLYKEYQEQLVEIEQTHIEHANSLVYVPKDFGLIGNN